MDRKPLIAVSREAAQTAEDARAIAIKKIDEMRLANERQDSADARQPVQPDVSRALTLNLALHYSAL
jgi:hypothetical protein